MRKGALLVFGVLAAMASATPAAAAVNAWELIHPKTFDWQQATHRIAIARDLLRRLNLLASVVPMQSPQQQALVLDEMAALDKLGNEAPPRRRSRLFMSRGYQHYRLLELIEETRENLNCILAAADIHEEMHCWSLAAQHFGDEARLDLALSMLRSARLIPKDGQMPVTAQDPEVWYGEYGRGILQYIIVPYLADATTRTEPATDAAVAAIRNASEADPAESESTQAEHADSGNDGG